MNSETVLKVINIALSFLGLLDKLGINYMEVIAAQKRAIEENGEGAEISADDLQRFVDQAQSAVDRL